LFVCKKPDGAVIRAHWNHITFSSSTDSLTITNPSAGSFTCDVQADVVIVGQEISAYEYRFYSPKNDPVQASFINTFGVKAVTLV
jgi:hypothetical protein